MRTHRTVPLNEVDMEQRMKATMRTENMVDSVLGDAADKTMLNALEQAEHIARYCGVAPTPARLRRVLAALLILADEVNTGEE